MKLAGAPLSLVDEDWRLKDQTGRQACRHCPSADGGGKLAGPSHRRGAPHDW
eukprot:COSAG02_NODE_59276_length_274_cov_2.314286_2_plen_51_part_01